MKTATLKSASQAALIVLGTSLFATSVHAAIDVKPRVAAKGKFYHSKATAKSSAQTRWGLKAASKYGAAYGLWGASKGKKMSCSKTPKSLWTCKASAKPAKKFKICKGRVQAKGMFYSTGKKALASAHGRWGLKAAAKYGAGYGFWNKSVSRGAKCDRKPNGTIQCKVTAKACR